MDRGRGQGARRERDATPRSTRQFEQTKDQSFPNEKAYQRFLKTSGQTEEDLQFRVRLDVLSNKIRQQVTEASQNVSDGEIEDYYDENEQQFSQPERRDLEVILTKKQAEALEAKQAVEGGERWSTVAKELSDDPASKEQGGKLLGVTKGQQDPKLDAAVFAAVESRVAGPVKTDAGYYVFRVTKVTKATKQSLEQSKQGIQQLLVSQKQQKELDQFSTNFRNDWRARTDCADGLHDRRLPQRPRADAGRHAAGAARAEAAGTRLDRRQPARARRDRQQPCRRQRRAAP